MIKPILRQRFFVFFVFVFVFYSYSSKLSSSWSTLARQQVAGMAAEDSIWDPQAQKWSREKKLEMSVFKFFKLTPSDVHFLVESPSWTNPNSTTAKDQGFKYMSLWWILSFKPPQKGKRYSGRICLNTLYVYMQKNLFILTWILTKMLEFHSFSQALHFYMFISF